MSLQVDSLSIYNLNIFVAFCDLLYPTIYMEICDVTEVRCAIVVYFISELELTTILYESQETPAGLCVKKFVFLRPVSLAV